jgi:hypothetical protein
MARRLTDVTRRSRFLLHRHQTQARGLRPPFSHDDALVASLLLIEVANTWQSFMRRYFLTSAVGGLLAFGGAVSGSGMSRSGSEALDRAVLFNRPNAVKSARGWDYRDEPNWMDPTIVSRTLHHLNLSNASGFTSAMSAGSGSYDRLYSCRNFVAHRNRGTALKVRQLARNEGVRHNLDPLELPHLPGRARPQSLVCDWLDELIAIVELVPQ